MSAVLAPVPEPTLLRLDFGCGKNKREGFTGVDSLALPGVDIVLDVKAKHEPNEHVRANLSDITLPVFKPWPWADDSVDEAHCSHFIEHLTWPERVHFFNELGRVLKKEAKCTVIWPSWASARFYGDPTHKEPCSEWMLMYLNVEWRKVNAPHADAAQAGPHPLAYTCDFDWTYGYNLHPAIAVKNQEYQMHALTFWKEAAADIVATITRR